MKIDKYIVIYFFLHKNLRKGYRLKKNLTRREEGTKG
jgi:hypothetical protein